MNKLFIPILFLLLMVPALSFSQNNFSDSVNSEFEQFKQNGTASEHQKNEKQPVMTPKKESPIEEGELISGGVDEAKKYGLVEYVIQAGAFKNQDSAVKFVEKLNRHDLDAFFFLDTDQLFKVRLGNYATVDTAKRIAADLKQSGIISNYQIVSPTTYSYTQLEDKGTPYVRDELVKTVIRHIGIPYKWGGTSVTTGFDCSGLMMVTYKMNGLVIPRNSRSQYSKGKHISKSKLQKGDLVFFATGSSRTRISHVGMYIGNGKFVHAPGRGKRVRTASLNNSYFKKRYIGSASYL